MPRAARSQAGKMVRLSEGAYAVLSTLAAQTGRSRQALVEQAIEDFRRTKILGDTARAYEEMRRDPISMREFEDEMAIWDRAADEVEGAGQG